MKYLPVLCAVHGWLLVEAEAVSGDGSQVIECEGHLISKDVRGIVPIEINESVPKTQGLSDRELDAALKLRLKARA